MKTDDDLLNGRGSKYSRGEELVTKLNYKPNYTERLGYDEDKVLEGNLRTDFSGNHKTRGIDKKTRNEHKRGPKLIHKPSNLHNYSSSSIFSLSNDDTFKSFDLKSK